MVLQLNVFLNSRWDRDEYVTVYSQNIQSGMDFNFRKYNWNHIQNLSAPYDLKVCDFEKDLTHFQLMLICFMISECYALWSLCIF
jgi:hypothetical protein